MLVSVEGKVGCEKGVVDVLCLLIFALFLVSSAWFVLVIKWERK
jgi:uncharacterized membrane protein